MSESRPAAGAPPRGTRALGAALIGGLLISATGLPARVGGVMPFVAELAVVVIGVLLALQLAQRALHTPRHDRVLRLAAVLLVLIGVGQLARSKRLFPLVPYTMYGRAEDGPASFYVYEAQHRSGARARFNVSTVFASLGNARIVKGLGRELDAIATLGAGGEDARARRAKLAQVMAALIARYNRDHASDPVTQVDAVQVGLAAPFDPSAAHKRTVMSFRAGAP